MVTKLSVYRKHAMRIIDAEILLCFRCGDGIEGLREQGHTNEIVCTFIEEFDTLFEV